MGFDRALAVEAGAFAVIAALAIVLPQLVLVLTGVSEPGSLIDDPRLSLGLPLALALYLAFWGIFEGVWMCYLLFAFHRWFDGTNGLRWRSLFAAALWFALVHAFTQAVAFDPSLPQVLMAATRGVVALLIPGILVKITGNGWGLVLWFTATNLGIPDL